MFDRTVINPTQVIETSRTIHEHRAPTDQSVKLLAEFEQKAFDKLISITRLDNNAFGAVWHSFKTVEDDRFHVVCDYRLNGEKRRFEISHSRMSQADLLYEIATAVRNRLIEDLSDYLTEDLFRNAKTSFK